MLYDLRDGSKAKTGQINSISAWFHQIVLMFQFQSNRAATGRQQQQPIGLTQSHKFGQFSDNKSSPLKSLLRIVPLRKIYFPIEAKRKKSRIFFVQTAQNMATKTDTSRLYFTFASTSEAYEFNSLGCTRSDRLKPVFGKVS